MGLKFQICWLVVSRLLKKAAGTADDRPGGLSHLRASTVWRRSGTGFPACLGLFQQPLRGLLFMPQRSIRFSEKLAKDVARLVPGRKSDGRVPSPAVWNIILELRARR
jgi:hypothetical protein